MKIEFAYHSEYISRSVGISISHDDETTNYISCMWTTYSSPFSAGIQGELQLSKHVGSERLCDLKFVVDEHVIGKLNYLCDFKRDEFFTYINKFMETNHND